VRGSRLRQPRRAGLGSREPGGARARRRPPRQGRLLHAGRHRDTGAAGRRAQPGRGGGGNRPRPHWAALRSAAEGERLPCSRRGHRAGTARGGAQAGSRLGRDTRRRSRSLEGQRDIRLRSRLRPGHRRLGELGAHPARRRALSHEGSHRRRRRDGHGTRSPQLLRQGAGAAHEHVLRPGALRPQLRGAGPRLPHLLRALDREPQPPGLRRPGGLRRGRPPAAGCGDPRFRGGRGHLRGPRKRGAALAGRNLSLRGRRAL